MSNQASDITNKIFDQFDTDKSGTLDRKELKKILDVAVEGTGQTVTEQDINDALREIDTDNSGTVSKAEFTALIQKLLA